jgi:DNA polymerase elongation subunit (family B)
MNNYRICEIESVEELNPFEDEYVYDIEMGTEEHTFFANDILIHNSIYLTLNQLVNNGLEFSNKPGKISKEFYDKVKELGDKLNNEIKIWGERELFSEDSRFVFKREAIADNGVFLQKKRYIIHVLDIEDIPCNKYKYVGVDVVRSTIPSAVKPYIKDIIETMLSTQDYSKTNILINKVWEIFKTLPIESIATVSNLNNYEVREQLCKGFEIAKGTPHHIKAAIFYNRLIERLQLTNKYEKISSGDKVRLLQVQTPNKYNIQKIAYKDYYPEEFKQFFEPDYELIFEKTVLAAIERLYENVRWELQRPGSLVQSNIFDLFS